MAQAVGKYAAKKMLGKQMEKYRSKDVVKGYDPYFEEIRHPRKPGKMKKVKKQVPDYIPEHDAIILAKMRQRAYSLDCCLFSLMGVRFGWSSVIGLVPAAGDFIDVFLAILLAWRCCKVEGGLPAWKKTQMGLNIALDFFIGLVPILGDLVDAGFKANTRNLRLLEEHLDKKYRPQSEKEPRSPATVYEEFSDDDDDLPRHNGNGRTERYEPRRPERARQAPETRGGPPVEKSNRWFSGGSKRERQPDIEARPARLTRDGSRRDRR